MTIKDFFTSRKKKENLSQLVSLIALAKLDGQFDQEEFDLIVTIAAKKGISPKDFTNALLNVQDVKFKFPKDEKTKFIFMGELILIMLADGKIDDKELIFCHKFGHALGYDNNFIRELIIDIQMNVNSI